MDYLQNSFIKKTQLHSYHQYILLIMMMMTITLLNIELSYQLDDNTICPKQCICSSKRMNCELSGLNYLPIPPPILQLEYLLIQNQTFMNTELGPNELSIYRSIEYGGQIQLKSLHIRYCNIISLKRNTFQILGKQLRLLDLTGNPLIHIEDYTFNGLDQLTLIMDEIKLRNFQLNTFNGLTSMKSLIIRNSNLNELPYQSLIQLITMSKLNQLIINGNQLKQLDKKYDVIFKELQHFEIHDNPWHCDCQLNWLIKRYQSMHKSHRNNTIENNDNNNKNKWNHNDEEDDNQPKCSTPFSLAGYKFNDLITDLSEVYDYNNPMINTWEKSNSPFILYCTPPQLERLDVDLTHLYQMENSMIKKTDHQQYPSVRLTCSMKGSRELSITWYYHNHNNNTMTLVNLSNHHITHRYPNNKQISYTNNDIIKVESQLDIIKQQQIDKYSCIGIDIISNVTATIQLQWPLLKIDNQLSLSAYNESKLNYLNNWSTTTTTSTSSSSTATTISSLSYTNSMLHIKQFSLGELIAATAGTFLSTVLLFFIIYQTFHCRLTSCDQRKLYRPHKTDHSSILEVPNLSPDGGGISSLNTLCNISRPNTITTTMTTTTTTSTTSTTTITTTTTNNSNNSSSNSSIETNLLQNSITNCPINQLNSESISLTTNLLNTQQFLNGLSGFNHGTLPVNIRQQTIQTELGRCIQPTSNSTIGDGSLNSMSYEPISYSDTNNVTYDVPWIVNTNTNDHNINHHKLMNMNQRITNEQCIPLLYNGLPTNLSNPIESNSNNLIHNGLFIPPPPSIPQPSLPNSCTNSTLSLKTVTIQPNIQSNLLFLQSGCYPQLMNSVTTNSQFNQGSIGLTNYLNYHS
ncbi:unnamed protein product [Schistosoma bovis]|nr:unnamed protein product [Schistosoma bovis]